MHMIYRGFDITQKPDGAFHTKLGDFPTEEEACAAISRFKAEEDKPPSNAPSYTPPTDEEMDELDRSFRESCLEYMQEREEEWRKEGFIWSWIDPEPTWCPHGEWEHVPLYGGGDLATLFQYPDAPCERIIRLSLIGGGQIKVSQRFAAIPPDWGHRDGILGGPTRHVYALDRNHRFDARIEVKAHCGDAVVKATGYRYPGEHYEMNAQAVVIRGNHQDTADRVAATLRKIEYCGENLLALLDGARGCAFCGRPLRDEVSKLIGVGPDCAKQNGIPHNIAAANKRLELRHKLLGEVA